MKEAGLSVLEKLNKSTKKIQSIWRLKWRKALHPYMILLKLKHSIDTEPGKEIYSSNDSGSTSMAKDTGK